MVDQEFDPSVTTSNRTPVWVVYVIFNFVGAFLCLWLMASIYRMKNKTSADVFIALICSGCTFMSLTCGWQCLVNVIHDYFWGGKLSCQIEAYFHVSSIPVQFMGVALLSVRNLLAVKGTEQALQGWLYPISVRHATWISIGVWIICAGTVAVLQTISPIYRMGGGIYCFYSFKSPAIAFMLLSLLAAILVMIPSYLWIWYILKRMHHKYYVIDLPSRSPHSAQGMKHRELLAVPAPPGSVLLAAPLAAQKSVLRSALNNMTPRSHLPPPTPGHTPQQVTELSELPPVPPSHPFALEEGKNGTPLAALDPPIVHPPAASPIVPSSAAPIGVSSLAPPIGLLSLAPPIVPPPSAPPIGLPSLAPPIVPPVSVGPPTGPPPIARPPLAPSIFVPLIAPEMTTMNTLSTPSPSPNRYDIDHETHVARSKTAPPLSVGVVGGRSHDQIRADVIRRMALFVAIVLFCWVSAAVASFFEVLGYAAPTEAVETLGVTGTFHSILVPIAHVLTNGNHSERARRFCACGRETRTIIEPTSRRAREDGSDHDRSAQKKSKEKDVALTVPVHLALALPPSASGSSPRPPPKSQAVPN